MNIKLFISEHNGFIHYRDENNNIVPVQVLQDNVIKLNKDLVITENTTGYRIVLYPTSDGTATYRLVSAPVSNTTFGSGGGNRRGVNVFDDGTFQGFTSNLNFTGAGVTVTIVNGQAVINIPDGAAGMIGGGGTFNRIPKFTPDGSTLGDSLLFDNGTTVQMGGTGAIPSAQFAMTSTTQGFLAPRMTTGERNLIGAPATGLLVYNTSTSLFSYWDGAAWQNIDSQAGGDVSGSGTTNFITKWTDGPNSVIGDSLIQDNGTNVGISTAPIAGTRFSVQSAGTTSATFIADFYNSTPTAMVRFRSDGYVSMGLANGSMTIGLGAGFNSTLVDNTFVGVNSGAAISTGTNNTGFGTNSLASITDGDNNTAVGRQAMNANTLGNDNTAIGHQALMANTSGNNNTAIGLSSLSANTDGIRNSAFGESALGANIGGDLNTAVGYHSRLNNTTGNNNTALGYQAGYTGTTSSDSVFLGYQAGYFEASESSKLFIDNTQRANEADGRLKALVYGVFDAATTNQYFTVNGHVLIREDLQFTTKTIDTTAGDSATINSPAGRFRKDTTGATFTLTNSFITADSIINLTYASDSGITGFDLFVVAGAGSAVITFTTSGVAAAPTANTDINFLVIN